MVNPFQAFRLLRDIARRRPILVGVIGLGMFVEAARVGRVLFFGGSVTVFGHSGAEEWYAADGGTDMAAYVLWMGFCGVVLLGSAIAAWRKLRAGGDVAPTAEVAAAESGAVPSPETSAARSVPGRPAGGAVVWRRSGEEMRPNRIRR